MRWACYAVGRGGETLASSAFGTSMMLMWLTDNAPEQKHAACLSCLLVRRCALLCVCVHTLRLPGYRRRDISHRILHFTP